MPRTLYLSSLSAEGALSAPLTLRVERAPSWADHVAQHDRKVVVALLARGVPIDQAKELAQEAWLRLVEQDRAGRLDEVQLPGLAIRQALFLAKDRGRHHQHAQRCTELGAAPLHNAEDQLFARDDLRRIAKIVRGTSQSTQRVFRLLYGHPPSTPQQAADRLGLSLQRVRQITCELRKLIRAHLEDTDHAP